MHTLKKNPARAGLIIGLALLVGLSIQAKTAYALYSPRLSRQVSIIQQHFQSSQAQNGTQSILEEIEQIKAYDKAKREAFKETSISGDAKVAQEIILNTTSVLKALDSLLMIVNFNGTNEEFISTCLRDEIWSLEALRDLVGSEMVKAYMLRDTFHGTQLKQDYLYLVTHIDLLRRYGSDGKGLIQATDASGEPVTVTSTKYFFGDDNTENYYTNIYTFLSNKGGCPEGEFQEAFKEVVNSAKTLAVLSAGKGVEWGDIWSMAQANARIRAREWIKANQISLTIGGEEGGRVESLVKGGGWDKFTGNVKTQLRIAKNMVGPVTPLWQVVKWTATKTAEGVGFIDECVFYYKPDSIQGGRLEQGGVFRNCDDEQKQNYLKCQKYEEAAKNDEEAAKKIEDIRCDRFRSTEEFISYANKANKQLELIEKNAQTKEEVETAFIYSINLDSVAEQNIYLLDKEMWDMNMTIKRGYEAVDEKAGKGIPTLFQEMDVMVGKHCPNKQ